MRIRILEPRAAQIDGVDLSVFHPGYNYEVDSSTATYLIVSGVAEPGTADAPALVVQSTEVMVAVGLSANGPPAVGEVADDWEEGLPPEPVV
jgi:hypothetical protein